MLRVGFDASPLARPHPRGIQRVVAETLDALEARGKIEVVLGCYRLPDAPFAWCPDAVSAFTVSAFT